MTEYSMVDLPAKFTISEGANIKKFLLKMAKRYDAVTMNGSKVIQMDTSGLQILFAFTKTLDDLNKPWNWHEPSEPLLSVALDSGMVGALKILENAE